jgi:phosphate transport system permease protein
MTMITAQSPSTWPAGRPRSKALRKVRESCIMAALIGCGAFSIATTLAIIVILGLEAFHFFRLEEVSFWGFITGTQWNPLLGAEKHFGIWPLISGTLLVTAVAMVVALPLGLITAIWLSEYARPGVRAVIKPILEVLAGIPTVVFGFFALTIITPGLRWLHEGFNVYNAASAGLAVAVMCLPIVTSLSEDALRAVPRSLREGAYGLGATRFEVSVKVVTPAALSGIVAAFLLAIARAVGETMIVSLAAGNAPSMTVDPRSQVQTMTGYMVQIFLGDASNFGPEYYSSYAVAATLFLMTLLLTVIGHRIRVRYRQVYE